MSADLRAACRPGDGAPFCCGMTADGRYYSPDQQVGRPVVLILAGALPVEASAALIEAFSLQAGAFERAGADIILTVSASAPGWIGAGPLPGGLRLLYCVNDPVFHQAGVIAEPAVVVADRSQHVVAALNGGSAATAAAGALACVRELSGEAARPITATAPVLMVPQLFDAHLRQALIAAFEAGDHVDGAMASLDAQGQAVNRLDAEKKRRRDLTLDPAGALHADVLDRMSRRLVPEIKRAFQVDIAHVDRVLIARYDQTGGFRRHCDNAAAQVAFRQFALSVNLNTGDYDGGALLFPEYDDHRYVPAAGAGIVFSASLLHEAAPVTRGARYVLLTFLHDDAAELRRRAGLEAALVAA